MDASWITSTLRLVPDPVARNKCLATTFIKEGSIIFAEESLSTVLLNGEKGKRCDACFRLPGSDTDLKKCSGCGRYWYCDTRCQNLHWTLNHKRICRIQNSFMGSSTFQNLPEHEKLDALLLSYTIARLSLPATPYNPPPDSSAGVLMTLLSHPTTFKDRPSETVKLVMPIKPPPPDNLVYEIYSRFGNNNFVVHSHLTGVGHGVFPFTSRLFNHSCTPNSVAKYRFVQGRSVVMEIVALRDIDPEEEITIPYLDPALFETRSKIFQISYGFACACSSCMFMSAIRPLPPLPTEETEMRELAGKLRQFAGVHTGIRSLQPTQLELLPVGLRSVLREDYISSLSEEFSRASHEGDHENALSAGLTLLALYMVAYPPNYPQIGMHLLELTKTAWNSQFLANMDQSEEIIFKERIRTFLSMTSKILMVYGPEGDEGGPLSEIETLRNLLSAN